MILLLLPYYRASAAAARLIGGIPKFGHVST